MGRQMIDRNAVKRGWLILDHAGRLKFRPRLMVTGAIVIGRDDGLWYLPSGHYSNVVLRVLGEGQRGEPTIWGRAPLIRVVGFVGVFSASARQ